MHLRISFFLFTILILAFNDNSFAQGKIGKKDTSFQKNSIDTSKSKSVADTVKKERSIASKAALRSTIFPGLGQIYNKKYWKLPLVYGALAFPISTFGYNRTWYQKTRFAYTVRSTRDSANFTQIDPELQPLSVSSLKLYRNEFRKNMDFSIIGLLLIWGLNVVDATVDGHLRTFDVSDELSMQIKPVISNNLGSGGLSMRIGFKQKENQPKTISF